jgi:transcriptional regulator PpsR
MQIPPLSPLALAQLIGVSADIALLLDTAGVVQEVSLSRSDWAALDCRRWVGRPWVETMAEDSRPKWAEMMAAHSDDELRWRHINHRAQVAGGNDVPLQYVAVPVAEPGLILVLGRDMSIVAGLQQRLMDAQQSMERDYMRLRHMEARYRILFETSSEPVLVVDVVSQRVMEANPAAQAWVKDAGKRLVGREINECFESQHRDAVHALLRMAQATGRAEIGRARFMGTSQDCTLSVSVFRQEGGAQFLIRLLSGAGALADAQPDAQAWFSEAMERSPTGLLITDRHGAVVAANAELVSLVGATSLAQLQGQPVERWLSRGSVDWGVLQTNIRQTGSVRGFATELRTMAGTQVAVEISALTLTGPQALYGFFVRDVGRQRLPDAPVASGMAGSVAQLAQLVGRMPMKDIVGETSDMIERMCIQAALQLTHNNRASAAEMLGLSRQSLYVKLRRYDMAGSGEAD